MGRTRGDLEAHAGALRDALGVRAHGVAVDVTDPLAVRARVRRSGARARSGRRPGQQRRPGRRRPGSGDRARRLGADRSREPHGTLLCIQQVLPAMLAAGAVASSISPRPPGCRATPGSPPTAPPNTAWSGSRARSRPRRQGTASPSTPSVPATPLTPTWCARRSTNVAARPGNRRKRRARCWRGVSRAAISSRRRRSRPRWCGSARREPRRSTGQAVAVAGGEVM